MKRLSEKKLGRPRAFDGEKSRLVEALYLQGLSAAQIMRRLELSHSTFYRLKASWQVPTLVIGVRDDLRVPVQRYNRFPDGSHPGYFDLQIAKGLAVDGHAKIRFKPLPFAELFSAVEQHQVDAAMGLIGESPGRRARVAFSEPYANFSARPSGALVAALDLQLSAQRLDSLAGLRLGVIEESLSDEWLVARGLPVIRFARAAGCHQALLTKQIDACLMSLPYQRHFVGLHPSYEIKPALVDFDHIRAGIITHRENHRLVAAMNAGIANLARTGVLAALQDKLQI